MLTLIQIMTTSKCPGNCKICPYSSSWHKNNPGYMNDEDFENVLQKIKDFEPDFDGQFCPYLMQDFLSDKNIIKRIETIFDYFPKCYMEISTNAMLLTPKLSEEIIETLLKYDKTNRSHIWLSHHSINKETFETLMQRKNYNKTLNNIIEYAMINDGRIKTTLRGSGASKDGSLFYFSGEEYQKYWQEIFSKNKLNPKNTQIDYFTFHNRAGNLKMKNWGFGDTFSRTINEFSSFDCWRYRTGLHILYNSEVVPCCLPKGSGILTAEYRWKNIEEIKKGDDVITHKGNIQKVKNIFKRNYSDKLYSFKTSNFWKKITTTSEHPLLVLRRKFQKEENKNDFVEFIEAWNIQEKDYLVLPKISKNLSKNIVLDIKKYLLNKSDLKIQNNRIYAFHKFYKRIIKTNSIPEEIILNKDVMWLFGIYLAEGWIRKGKQYGEMVFSLSSDEEDIKNKIIRILKNLDINFRYRVSYYRNKNMDLHIRNRPICYLFQTLFGTGSANKFIHSDIMNRKPSLLLSLAEGEADGDGCEEDRRLRIVTTSELLANQLYLIYLHNNIVPSLYQGKPLKKLPYYEISVSYFKNKMVLQDDENFYYLIRDIDTRGGNEEVYNFEVDVDNSYVVDVYAVHNCMDYSHKNVWGNLKEQSLKEIWNGEKRKDFIDKAVGLKESDDDFICKKCLGVGG